MDHDRLFKELLTTFFIEFLELFLPQVVEYIDRDSIVFLDKEVFTDVTTGDRHEVDLVAKVRFRDRNAFLLLHVEQQAQPPPRMPRRMFLYCARLEEKYDLPVYPIVIFSYDAPLREESNEYVIQFPDRMVLKFSFVPIQLNRLNWRDYVRRENPVAAALMAKMRIEPQERPYVKLQCLRLLATLKLTPAKMQLISGFVDSYLKLTAAEETIFKNELAAIAPQEQEHVMEITTTWEQIGIEKGIERGVAQGQRQTVKRLLGRRMGRDVVEQVAPRLESLAADALGDLAEALLDFTSPAELDAWLQARGA